MNAVSIPAATLASLPQPMKSGAAPASSHAAGESGFKGQLKDAIQERKGRSGEKDSKQGDASTMHYMTHFSEKLLPSNLGSAQRPLPVAGPQQK